MSRAYLPHTEPLPPQHPIVYQVKKMLAQCWNKPQPLLHYNPGPNPVSLERKHLNLLKTRGDQCVVGEKSDGVRYFLILGCTWNSQQKPRGFAVMVNRNMDMFEVAVCAQEHWYRQGCIFDGEIVLRKCPGKTESDEDSNHYRHENIHRQVYLVFDVYWWNGHQVMYQPWVERHEKIAQCFDTVGQDVLQTDPVKWTDMAEQMAHQDKIVALGNHMALQFQTKPFVPWSQLSNLYRTMSQLPHSTDGLVMTGDFLHDFEVEPGVSDSQHSRHPPGTLKWKPYHTIDFLVTGIFQPQATVNLTGPYPLCAKWTIDLKYQREHEKVSALQRVFEIDESHHYEIKLQPNSVLEQTCRYYGDHNKLVFRLIGEVLIRAIDDHTMHGEIIKWRKDKTSVNYEHVVVRTLRNVMENIQIEELMEISVQKMLHFS